MTEPTPSKEPTHTELYGNVSKVTMAALLDYCKGLEPTFRPDESSKMILAAGFWLLAVAVGRDEAVRMTRELCARIEAGQPSCHLVPQGGRRGDDHAATVIVDAIG